MNKNETASKSTVKRYNIIIITITSLIVLAALGSVLWFTVLKDVFDDRNVPEALNIETDEEGRVLQVTPAPDFEPVDTIQLPWIYKSITPDPELEGYEQIDSSLVNVEITSGLSLVSIGSYTGMYIEEGKDVEVKDVIAVTVYNGSENDLQYAEIYVSVGEVFAQFDITCLPSGSSVTVLEKRLKNYVNGMQFKYITSSNVAFFNGKMPLHSDTIFVTCIDGYLNITNMSDTAIDSDVIVYYKKYKDGRYFGGITYTVTVKGGISAKSSVMMAAPHFDPDESKVMFVIYDEQ